MTNEEARAYFINCNERIVSVAKDENGYNYETQQIKGVFARRTFEANELAIKALDKELKTGHWIKYGVPRCGEQHYKCTSCGYYINFGQWGELYTKEFKYCPNCKAKMVESPEE